MKTLVFATLTALGTTLIAGCGSQLAEEGPGAQKDYAPMAVTDDGRKVSEERIRPVGPALDGRARAAADAASGAADTPKVQTITPFSSWYTGSLSVGEEQHWIWNNAGPYAYQVGFSPVGASTAVPCQFQVTRSWDVQPSGGGNRQFHFVVKNVGDIACGANILLQGQVAQATWSTGGLNPGATQGWTWYNANPLSAAHFVNVVPSGATSSDACEFEVTRSWYSQQPGGERRFYFYVKNVGRIACVGAIQLAANPAAGDPSWNTGNLTSGGAAAWFWNNANPLNRVYVPGVSPQGAWGPGCQLELLPTFYQQVINPDGSSQRRYYVGVRNVGAISCSGNLLLNHLDS